MTAPARRPHFRRPYFTTDTLSITTIKYDYIARLSKTPSVVTSLTRA